MASEISINSALPASDKGENVKVLIVDDEGPMRNSLSALMSLHEYACDTASSGKDAIETLLKSNHDVILLDVYLPDISGVDVCRILKGNPQTMHTQVIIYTDNDDRFTKAACLEAGASDFLVKPIDPLELISKIRNFSKINRFEDIREKKERLQHAFRLIARAKEEWEQAVDVINDVVILTDEKDHVLRCNKALAVLTNKSFGELLNKKWQDILKLTGCTSTISDSGDIEFFYPGGRWFNFNIYYTKNTGAIKRAAAIITFQDITDRKKREKEMQLLQQLTRAINESRDFNSALRIMLKEICETTGWVYAEAWFPSPDGTHLYCSPIWYSREDGLKKLRVMSENTVLPKGVDLPGHIWLSKKPLLVKDMRKDPNSQRALYAAEAGIAAFIGIPVISGSEVVLVLSFFTFSINDEDEDLLNLVSAVTTQLWSAIQRKKTEDELKIHKEILEQKSKEIEDAYTELKAIQSQMLQREKMASIGQLAAGVAHEINNPMGFIISNLKSLQKYAGRLSEFVKVQSEVVDEMATRLGDDGSGLADKIKESRRSLKIDYITEDIGNLLRETFGGTDRVKDIVQDLKSFSRTDEVEHKMADINEGIESTINIVWNELKYKATLKKEYGDIPLTKCNPGHLNQVFLNMLVNAAHSIEKQGEISVKTWSDGGHIYISISDTGCGIPEDKINRIFEPFFTTKAVGDGTGLGLSIAYDIIRKHNGDITIKSEVGKGTAFTIKVPIVGGKDG